MSYRSLKSVLLACSGAAVLLAASTAANAGGLGVREQSAYGQGSSFAGVAAGGSLSSMFWNPATITQVPGMQFEAVASGILPYASNTPSAGSTLLALGGTGNIGDEALVPASYASKQLTDRLWVGMSINAPFGLSVTFPDMWAGRTYAAGSSNLKTYNFTPSIAYAVNDWISVGAGVQIQYATARLNKGLGATPTNQFILTGGGWGYGFTAGVTLTPTPNTTIGLGYRSAINQDLNGTMALPAGAGFNVPFSTPGSVSTSLKLPDIVSLGLRHKLSPTWMVMATVEWTNWSRIGTSNVSQPNGAPALVGTSPVTLPFQYKDGWFYSLGAEHQWSDRLALRAGIAFEKSPITDDIRIPLLPDNDRLWLSLGATYNVTRAISVDFAYSHIFIKNAPIAISPTSGNPWYNPVSPVSYFGNVTAHADIVSVALKYRFDDPAPVRTTRLITK